jgi:hypothetical protein
MGKKGNIGEEEQYDLQDILERIQCIENILVEAKMAEYDSELSGKEKNNVIPLFKNQPEHSEE